MKLFLLDASEQKLSSVTTWPAINKFRDLSLRRIWEGLLYVGFCSLHEPTCHFAGEVRQQQFSQLQPAARA
jgi:hypothetical protein